MTLMISDTIKYETSVDSLKKEDLDEDDRKTITEDLAKADIQLSLTNYLPIGADVSLYIATDSTELFSQTITDPSEKIIINVNVQAGTVGNSGYVETPANSTENISLTDEQLEIFREYAPIFTRQVVKIMPTTGIVSFRQADKIEVDALVSIRVLVNNE